MKNIIKFFLLASILFVSCKKDSEHDATGHVVVKGINKLIVSVVHHTYSISNVRVYLKNNATEFPGTDTTKYEWNMVSDDSGIAVFENLFEGNYFLYAEGFDQNIGMNVIGGSPIQLNSTTIANNELYVTLYVTE